MRRKQFIQLIDKLRDELSINSDPAVGSGATPNLKQVLSRTYETLYDAYDWPHLRELFPRINLQAGERYYDFPETMDFDNLEDVKNWWGGRAHSITRGIGFEEYTVYDSESGIRADPAYRWDVRFVDNKEMLEVWPVPAGSGQAIQFKGKLKFKPLIDDEDQCLLDDQLVVLYAAAELSPPKKRTDINAKLNAAQARLGVLKARSAGGSASFRVGLAGEKTPFRGAVIRIGR